VGKQTKDKASEFDQSLACGSWLPMELQHCQ
jgi:hypothetical protein